MLLVGAATYNPYSMYEQLLRMTALSILNLKLDLAEVSMGMTNDYLDALEYNATFLRIGSSIFGERS